MRKESVGILEADDNGRCRGCGAAIGARHRDHCSVVAGVAHDEEPEREPAQRIPLEAAPFPITGIGWAFLVDEHDVPRALALQISFSNGAISGTLLNDSRDVCEQIAAAWAEVSELEVAGPGDVDLSL